jgi:cysteine desulfurase
MDRIDLDQNATTPLDPAVLAAMRPHWLAGGNAESRHALGRAARRALDQARETVAAILKADPTEVVFTSGGTEANNLAIFGLAGDEPGHVVTSPIEHPAVAEPLTRLEALGWAVDRVAVRTDGRVDAGAMAAALRSGPRLATLMLANNETGAIQPVAELAELAATHGIRTHTDAAQAVGRIPVDFHGLGVDTLAASAHKFHGPTGVGLLLVRRGVKLQRHLFGGSQQGERRPGTVPVALAVGLAAALDRWHQESQQRVARWRRFRDKLEAGLIASLGPDRAIRNGPADDADRLPQTLNVGFPGLDGDTLLMGLDLAGVCVSLGAACASGATAPSPTLTAMGVPADRLRSSIRISFGAMTTEAEIDEGTRRVVAVVGRG